MARKPRSADDYQDAITAASRSGLAEIMTALGAYRDALVLIGGWAPYLVLEQFGYPGFGLDTGVLDVERLGGFVHVGSIDIDLVVDPALINAEQYATIVELLLDRGYEPTTGSLFQFERLLRSPRDGEEYLIRVDLLTPSPLRGEGRARRHRDIRAEPVRRSSGESLVGRVAAGCVEPGSHQGRARGVA